MSLYTCICGDYTFFCQYGTVVTEVYPLNFLETSLTDEYERGWHFYRRKFNGSLVFGGRGRIDDWNYLKDIEDNDPCAEIIFTIKKDGVNYWIGYFSTTDGIFDIDSCTFEVTPLVYDAYKSILDNIKKEYNILAVDHDVITHAIRGTISVTYSRNMWLTDVIEYLAGDATAGVKPGCTVSSDFFTDATNYATELDNELTLLTIASKSDIIDPLAVKKVASLMLSWEGLMQILWAMFQVTWNYDPDTDTINVEHISWFTTSGSLDTRGQKLTVAVNKYQYLKERMPKYEFFEMAEADEINFVGTYIYYPSACINDNSVQNRVDTKINVTTDIEYIINNPDSIGADGFVIMANYEDGGDYYVIVSAGALYSANARLNMPLSWANLHNAFFRHYRSAIRGYLNGNLIDFYSAKPTKRQSLAMTICEEFDPEAEIITELGQDHFGGVNGIVEKAELKPSGHLQLSVLYAPPENPIVPVAPKIANFIQTSETIVEVWLSQPSDANYSLHIYEEMYDDSDPCVLLCSEGQPADPESFVINIGETYATFTFADTCTPFVAGYSFVIQIDDAAMLANGWTVTFERNCDYINTDCWPCGT